ncbi:hypothetical protein PIB30_095154 [Stylosanthes scabra]|uniref:Uncharacterized protein n=1 Tax=Stylosanthes scabra TaxID=79078 RepID=A0ABU6WV74_9FABA|nr:hypothetical protein [Stylosanthes scabra]
MASISSNGRWLRGGKGICPHRMRRIQGYSSTGTGLTDLRTVMYVCVSFLDDTGGRIHSRLRYLAGSEQEISWHGRWASRHEQTFTVVEVQDPGPSADYLRWWYLAARKFLAPDDAIYPRPLDEIPPEAIQRVADTPVGGNQVDDVPDNRRPGRRRMVGTRTTDRDWQWLDEMLGYEAAAPRRVRRMPEDGGRRGGRGGRTEGRTGEARSLHPRGPPVDYTCGDEGGATMGRGRRFPRRRGCGTGGHM